MKKLFYFLLLLVLCPLFSCNKTNEFKPEDFSFPGIDNTFYLPMAFTPNGDLVNEDYRLFCVYEGSIEDEITTFQLDIKDNSKLIYSTQDTYFMWKGTDKNGKPVSGIFKVKLQLGLNGQAAKTYDTQVLIIRDNCIPANQTEYIFGDRIDAHYGVIYDTMEPICQ